MLFTVYSFHWGFPAPDIFTATSELPVNCDQADKLCLKYPSNLVGRWNRNASVAKCRAMSKTKKIILSHSVDPSSRYGHTIYLQACKLVYVQHYLAVKSDKCWQCLGRDETLSHPISSSSSLQAWLCQISIPNYPFRKNQISLDTAWEKLEITQCISLAGWLLCDISLQISQNLVPTLSAGANYLIYLQHYLPDFPLTPFTISLEINLLCAICQKFCHSISGFLAHWSLGFVCNFHSAQLETTKCYFSKTCGGEKRRRANDCYLGVSLISQRSALFNGSPQTILSHNISKFKSHPPYYR